MCIRKKPQSRDGTDSHRNIAFVGTEIGKILFTEDVETARNLLRKFRLDEKQKNRLNRLRNNYGYHAI